MENFDIKEDEIYVVYDLVEFVYGFFFFVVFFIRYWVGRWGLVVGGIFLCFFCEYLIGGMGYGVFVYEVYFYFFIYWLDCYLGVLLVYVGGDLIFFFCVIDFIGCVIYFIL